MYDILTAVWIGGFAAGFLIVGNTVVQFVYWAVNWINDRETDGFILDKNNITRYIFNPFTLTSPNVQLDGYMSALMMSVVLVLLAGLVWPLTVLAAVVAGIMLLLRFVLRLSNAVKEIKEKTGMEK